MNPYPPPHNWEPSNYGESSNEDDQSKTSHLIRWNSGKRVEPRLLGMLEMFGEIYVERREFFDKIFHGDHEEVFKKIGHALKTKKKQMSMKRSMSMRSIRQRGINLEENGSSNEFRDERFKIRAPNVIVAEGDEQEDQPTEGSK